MTNQIFSTALREDCRKELGIDVPVDAIKFTTFYLKFDRHEWGIGGFVDLRDSSLKPEHKYTYEQLVQNFVGGYAKDKNENDEVIPKSFTLESMVPFIQLNQRNMASSSIVVAIHTLEQFFGSSKVQRAFASDKSEVKVSQLPANNATKDSNSFLRQFQLFITRRKK